SSLSPADAGSCPGVGVARSPAGPLPTTSTARWLARPAYGSRTTRSPRATRRRSDTAASLDLKAPEPLDSGASLSLLGSIDLLVVFEDRVRFVASGLDRGVGRRFAGEDGRHHVADDVAHVLLAAHVRLGRAVL